ncbi:MAG: N-terminal phage integrase SAM-like domain-containing protein, partial [Kiritimatiellaeota bacterium]|nr:N-terminal phage integrase SAM-like domain-containing protein [Kiritimatiellota bacterium]
MRHHILPTFGNAPIAKLTRADINAFTHGKLHDGRMDGNGGLSPKTVRDILSILKGIMDCAANEKLIAAPVPMTYPKQRRKSMRVLSRAEQSTLKAALLDGITIHKVGILLCLYTGLRLGEV